MYDEHVEQQEHTLEEVCKVLEDDVFDALCTHVKRITSFSSSNATTLAMHGELQLSARTWEEVCKVLEDGVLDDVAVDGSNAVDCVACSHRQVRHAHKPGGNRGGGAQCTNKTSVGYLFGIQYLKGPQVQQQVQGVLSQTT
jgi:hypothetical protein